MSGSSSVRRPVLAVHCDFYSTLQQSPETAAKDTERKKKLIIIYMITLIIAQVLELGEKRPDSQPPEGKCLGTNHW